MRKTARVGATAKAVALHTGRDEMDARIARRRAAIVPKGGNPVLLDNPFAEPRMLAISVRDFRGVEFREVEFPDSGEGVVTLQAPNKGGKSIILDAIEWAMRENLGAEPGKRTGTRQPPEQLVRDGAEQAEVIALLDGYTLTKTVDQDGKRHVYLRDTEGRTTDAAKMLKSWVNAWSFNAAHFMREANAGNFAYLADVLMADLGCPLTAEELASYGLLPDQRPEYYIGALDKVESTLYESRAAANGRRDEYKAIYDGLQIAEGTPEKEPDFEAKGKRRSELIAERGESLRKQAAAAEDATRAQRTVANGRNVIEVKRRQIAGLEGEIAQIEKSIKDAEGLIEGSRARSAAAAFKGEKELAKLESDFVNFQDLIAKWQTRANKDKALADFEKEKVEAKRRDDRLQELRLLKQSLPSRLKLPVEGLAVVGGKLLLTRENDEDVTETRPLTEWNEGTQLEVAIEVAATRLKPGQMRFVLVPSASLMTRSTFDRLRAVAKRLHVLLICEVATDDLRKLGDSDVWLEVA